MLFKNSLKVEPVNDTKEAGEMKDNIGENKDGLVKLFQSQEKEILKSEEESLKLKEIQKSLFKKMRFWGEVKTGEFNSTKKYIEIDGIIYFNLDPSDGTSGLEWIQRLKNSHIDDVPSKVKQILSSDNFTPTKGVEYRVAIIKGSRFYDKIKNEVGAWKRNPITKDHIIITEAMEEGLKIPTLETALMLWDQITKKGFNSMDGLWLIVMHDPISVSNSNVKLRLKLEDSYCGEKKGLGTICKDWTWTMLDNFAFVVS